MKIKRLAALLAGCCLLTGLPFTQAQDSPSSALSPGDPYTSIQGITLGTASSLDTLAPGTLLTGTELVLQAARGEAESAQLLLESHQDTHTAEGENPDEWHGWAGTRALNGASGGSVLIGLGYTAGHDNRVSYTSILNGLPAGWYRLRIAYMTADSGAVLAIRINGEEQTLTCPPTTDQWAVYEGGTAAMDIRLTGSGDSLTLYDGSAAGSAWIDSLTLEPLGREIEAESPSAWSGTAGIRNVSGASGGQVLCALNYTADHANRVVFSSLPAARPGYYRLRLDYMTGDRSAALGITVNGIDYTVGCPPTTDQWSVYEGGRVELLIPLNGDGQDTLALYDASAAGSAWIDTLRFSYVGTLDYALSDLTGPSGGVIPAASLSLRVAARVDGIPEALLPVTEVPVDNKQPTAVWITVHVPRDIPAGEYTGQLTLTAGDGARQIPIRLIVLEITLPEVPSIPAAVGVYNGNLAAVYGVENTPEALASIQTAYLDYLLEYRVSPYFFEWLGTDGRINAYSLPGGRITNDNRHYLTDHRLTCLMLPYFSLSSADFHSQMQEIQQYAILDRCRFYLYDEITAMTQVTAFRQAADALHAVSPQAKILSTYYTAPPSYSILDVPALLRGYTDSYCISNDAASGSNSQVIAQTRQRLQGAEELWSYVCNNPPAPYPNLHLSMSGFSQRANLWRSFADRTDGFLYWSANHYADYRFPASSSAFWFPDLPKGDGVLVYDAAQFPEYRALTAGGIAASVRLERLRDSLEDYEYLAAYRARFGDAAADTALHSVYSGPAGYTDSVQEVEALRASLAAAVADADAVIWQREAEQPDAWFGTAFAPALSGASGGQILAGLGWTAAHDNRVSYTPAVPGPGLYRLNIRYMTGDPGAQLTVEINGVPQQISCPVTTDQWTAYQGGSVSLDIRLTGDGTDTLVLYDGAAGASVWLDLLELKKLGD